MTFGIGQVLQQLRPADRLQDATEKAIEKLTPTLAIALAPVAALDPTKQLDARRVFAASACDHSRDFGDEPTNTRPRRGLSSSQPGADPVAELAEDATEAASSNIIGQSVRLAGSGLAVAGTLLDDKTANSSAFKGAGNKLGVAGLVVSAAGFAEDPSLDNGLRTAASGTGVAAILTKGGTQAALRSVGTAGTVAFSAFDTVKALKEGDEGKAAVAALPAVGAGVGAAIGACGFGVGAVPGAAVGAAVGSFASAGISIAGDLFG